MQAAGGEVPTRVQPKARPERQVGVLEGPICGDPDTNQEEAAKVPVLDEPPVVEAAGGVIEMGTVEGQEYPGGMAPGNVDESREATPAPMPVLLPRLEEYQDMSELEDAEPEDDPREEPLMNVPPAETGMDLRDLPPLEDGRFEEDKEESLADIPWIEEPLVA